MGVVEVGRAGRNVTSGCLVVLTCMNIPRQSVQKDSRLSTTPEEIAEVLGGDHCGPPSHSG